MRSRVPNSKYHAHRALILASLAPGTSRIHGLSDARHVQYTIDVLRALGTKIEIDGQTFLVTGGPYSVKRKIVSVGSSGSTLYFMIGLAALADAPITLTAQKYFRPRPVGPLLHGTSSRWAWKFESAQGCPPISVTPGKPGAAVSIVDTRNAVAVDLWPLVARTVRERTNDHRSRRRAERTAVHPPHRRHDARVRAARASWASNYRRFEVEPGQQARPTTFELPSDIGSAAFGLAVTAIHPSDVLFRGLQKLPGELPDHPEGAFLDIVSEMGLPMAYDANARAVRVKHDGIELRGMRVDCRDIPDMLPILSTLGTFARGETILENIEHVRLKESDRVAAMLQLNRMGGRLELHADRLVAHGVPALFGAKLSSFNDHRILMSSGCLPHRAPKVRAP